MDKTNQSDETKMTMGQNLWDDIFEDTEFADAATETMIFDELFEEENLPEVNIGTNPVNQQPERFGFVQELGEGAYGKVWKADDAAIGRTVAVKSYKFAGAKGAKLLDMETSIVGKIDHPGVPVLYDIQQTDDGLYHYIMKYVEGQTLEDVIERLRNKDPDTQKMFKHLNRAELILQILRTLASTHSKGIVHRDIKPENIMIGKNGEAYLMDWGIALDINENDGEGQLSGTPRYMSPEQAQSKAIDPRSDLFSIVGVLYEFITLKEHGPKASSALKMLEKIPTYMPSKMALAEPHPEVGPYPMTYCPIFVKGLQLNPNERYQSAEEMIQDLEYAMSGGIHISCPLTLTYRISSFFTTSLVNKPVASFLGIWGGLAAAAALLVFIGSQL